MTCKQPRGEVVDNFASTQNLASFVLREEYNAKLRSYLASTHQPLSFVTISPNIDDLRGDCEPNDSEENFLLLSFPSLTSHSFNMLCEHRGDTAPTILPPFFILYIELAISFLIGRKRTVNFRNQRP